MINISELPDKVKEAYDKWRTITDIDNLNSFFEDFYIFCKEKIPRDNTNVFDCLTFNEIKKGKEYYDEHIVMTDGKDLELSLWRIKDEHLYVYLTKYIEEINEQYEYFRRTNT